MNTKRLLTGLRGLLLLIGMPFVKRAIWNREFSSGHWMCLDSTANDCVYPLIEKYAKGGDILDLGCGSGNTANELPSSAYRSYTGVDISDVAIVKAKSRSTEGGRVEKTRYVRSDISTYVPDGCFDIIMFRDSIYYFRAPVIGGMLNRYARHLKEGGVFIVRMYSVKGKYRAIADLIGSNYEVFETSLSNQDRTSVIIFRPCRSRGVARGIQGFTVGRG